MNPTGRFCGLSIRNYVKILRKDGADMQHCNKK